MSIHEITNYGFVSVNNWFKQYFIHKALHILIFIHVHSMFLGFDYKR